MWALLAHTQALKFPLKMAQPPGLVRLCRAVHKIVRAKVPKVLELLMPFGRLWSCWDTQKNIQKHIRTASKTGMVWMETMGPSQRCSTNQNVRLFQRITAEISASLSIKKMQEGWLVTSVFLGGPLAKPIVTGCAEHSASPAPMAPWQHLLLLRHFKMEFGEPLGVTTLQVWRPTSGNSICNCARRWPDAQNLGCGEHVESSVSPPLLRWCGFLRWASL